MKKRTVRTRTAGNEKNAVPTCRNAKATHSRKQIAQTDVSVDKAGQKDADGAWA